MYEGYEVEVDDESAGTVVDEVDDGVVEVDEVLDEVEAVVESVLVVVVVEVVDGCDVVAVVLALELGVVVEVEV